MKRGNLMKAKQFILIRNVAIHGVIFKRDTILTKSGDVYHPDIDGGKEVSFDKQYVENAPEIFREVKKPD